jgi:uncharacterized membrane protein YqhA
MTRLINAVFSLHYVAILAIIAPFFGAVLMLLLGTRDTVEAYLLFFGLEEPEGAVEAGEAAMISLVASIDHFLFSAILMIFAIGLYFLFFRSASHGKSIDKDNPQKTFSWKHLKNMGGMDEMLLKVIIMLLAVSFLEFMLNTGIGNLDWTILVMPLTIIALALGLRWMSVASEEEEREELQTAAKTDETKSTLDELERLADLHERGSITDSEFDKAKTELGL